MIRAFVTSFLSASMSLSLVKNYLLDEHKIGFYEGDKKRRTENFMGKLINLSSVI